MSTPWLVKILVVLALLAVVASVGVALVLLVRDRGQGTRMVKALTVRVGVSVLLFVLLVAGALTGVIVPHGVVP